MRTIEREIGDLTKSENGVLVDLLLSYRAGVGLDGYGCASLPATASRRLAERGPNSGTCALLGRIYKDRWEEWEPETTARNLRLIREARERRGSRAAWAEKI